MAYDLIRWAAGTVVFLALTFILIFLLKKDKVKSAFISAATAVVLVWIALVVPIENVVYSFKSVDAAFSYRYTDELIGYAECDEGVVCIAKKSAVSTLYYSFGKDEKGYKMPKSIFKKASIRSSEHGIFVFESFESQTVIITQVKDAEYSGDGFVECAEGYYTYTVDGTLDYSALTCAGEKLTLV